MWHGRDHCRTASGQLPTNLAPRLRLRLDCGTASPPPVKSEPPPPITPPPPSALPPAAEAVLTFLQSVGQRSEAELYVRLFRQLPKESFAIIAAGAPVVQRSAGSLIEQLRFLSELGLFAPLVLGLLDPESAPSSAQRLLKRMPALGLRATAYDFDDTDLLAKVRLDLRQERTPILYFEHDPNETVADRFQRLGALAQALDTRKLVLLRRRGALRPQREQRVELAPGHVLPTDRGGLSIINLRSDLSGLVVKRVLRKQDLELLERVSDLLIGQTPSSLLVSITSPLDLLRELFTVRGAGTLIKPGTSIRRAGTYEELDQERLRRLLETSFGRAVKAELFTRQPSCLYVESNYRGAAIVESARVAPYLSKFAVDPVARGEGMAHDIWQAVARDHAQLFWRTRATNPISKWYSTLADGVLRLPQWHVFWRGLVPAAIPEVIDQATSRPEDFTD